MVKGQVAVLLAPPHHVKYLGRVTTTTTTTITCGEVRKFTQGVNSYRKFLSFLPIVKLALYTEKCQAFYSPDKVLIAVFKFR